MRLLISLICTFVISYLFLYSYADILSAILSKLVIFVNLETKNEIKSAFKITPVTYLKLANLRFLAITRLKRYKENQHLMLKSVTIFHLLNLHFIKLLTSLYFFCLPILEHMCIIFTKEVKLLSQMYKIFKKTVGCP